MNLSEYLEEYKTLTLVLIDAVENDDEMNGLIRKREEILESINNLNFDEKELKTIENSLKLLDLEEELQNSVKKEKVKIKKQIEVLKKTRKANANYNNIENKARVFNRSI